MEEDTLLDTHNIHTQLLVSGGKCSNTLRTSLWQLSWHLTPAGALTVNLARSSITSYPSTVGVMGRSSSCWLPNGSDMDRGQLEYSTDGSRDPFTLALMTGLRAGGGGVLLRPQRGCCCDAPRRLLGSSPAVLLTDEEDELLETLPSDDARWGRLNLPLAPDNARSMGTGTGTNGDAIFWLTEGNQDANTNGGQRRKKNRQNNSLYTFNWFHQVIKMFNL